MFNIGERDILRSKQITPGFYDVLVENAFEDVAGTDGSKVIKFEGKILNAGEFENVPLNWQFSEKAPGFAIPFFKAIGAPIGEEGDLKKGGTLNEKNAIGKKIKVGVKNELYQGRMVNRADQFLPADAQV